jgi:hypothetical protein
MHMCVICIYIYMRGQCPGANEWSISYLTDGEFSQRISIQLESEEALKRLIAHVHGCGVQVSGHNLVVEGRSIHPLARPAGREAQCVIPPPQALIDQFDSNAGLGGLPEQNASLAQIQEATVPTPSPDAVMGDGDLVNRALSSGLDLRGFVPHAGGAQRL